jgi:ankyrin repeat protein
MGKIGFPYDLPFTQNNLQALIINLIIITVGLFFSSCERKLLKHRFPPYLSFTQEMRPLGDAIYNDNAREVKRILTEKKLSPNTLDKNDRSLLIYAIVVSSRSVVKTLLEMGADPNLGCEVKVPSDGKEPHIEKEWPLATAVYLPDLYYVDILLKYGADVNIGYPLHSTINNARYKNTMKLLNLFIDKGSNINALDYLYTPLSQKL